uniref:Xrn1 helical domain-containing protein n=1 Tax=Cynoglossus semilaevis TaxID=244447 RepID=A0A3P8V6K8_CYNSE
MFTEFEKDTKPFKPLEQLMGVFPAASGNFLPSTWRNLMSSPDSSIIDFYPDDFAIDLNGKKYAWQGVRVLPFVDERRLRIALTEVYPDLTPDEVRRNSLGSDIMFLGRSHPLFDFIHELYRTETQEATEIPAELCHGIQGRLNLDDDPILPEKRSVIRTLTSSETVKTLTVLFLLFSRVKFKDPLYEDDFVFKAVLLPGAKIPSKVLKPDDWVRGNREPWKPQLVHDLCWHCGVLHHHNTNTPLSCGEVFFTTENQNILHHNMDRNQHAGGGQYSNAAPPNSYQQGRYCPPHSGGHQPYQREPALDQSSACTS